MVKINGEQKDKAGMTIEEYLAEAGLSKGRVAVERNGEIVPGTCTVKPVLRTEILWKSSISWEVADTW